jgi:dTDP-4-amino-4,6-dideoxygalactose transaminase
LKGSGVVLPEIHPDAEPVWHLFVARVPDRDRFQAHLKEKGVATGVHYPIPLHRQPAYEYLGMPEGSLPITEKIAATVVSLPMFPELTDAQKDTVIQGILDFGF